MQDPVPFLGFMLIEMDHSKEIILETQPISLIPLMCKSVSSEKIPEETKVCPSQVQICDPAIYSLLTIIPSLQSTEDPWHPLPS